MKNDLTNLFLKLITQLIIVLFSTSSFSAPEYHFECEKFFPSSLYAPVVKNCNSTHVIGNNLNPSAMSKTDINNQLFQDTQLNNNLGGIKVVFNSTTSKVIYRSAYLAMSPMCIQSLAQNNVKTIINLYSGDLGYAESLLPLEKDIALSNGVEDYINIEGYMVNALKLSNEALNQKISSILRAIETAKGNVLIHCYTGEHDTGVIFGILNKCYNHLPLDSINNNLMCHMETKSAYGKKTTARAIQIIKAYPCSSSSGTS